MEERAEELSKIIQGKGRIIRLISLFKEVLIPPKEKMVGHEQFHIKQKNNILRGLEFSLLRLESLMKETENDRHRVWQDKIKASCRASSYPLWIKEHVKFFDKQPS